jgi:predicted N-acetyltransferase YhbS
LDEFDSRDAALDDWLNRFARQAEAAGSARTFVTTADERIVGYYTLAAGGVMPKDSTVRLGAGQPAAQPVPVVLLARLAVDRAHQQQGVGRSLLMDALIRAVGAAEAVGMRAVVVNAYGDAVSFYEQFGFEPSPTDPLHLMLLMKDLRKFLSENH